MCRLRWYEMGVLTGDSGEAMSKKRWILALVGAVVLVAVAAWFLRSGDAVETVRLEEQEIVERLVVTGEVASVSRAELSTQVAGRVLEVKVREGAEVEAGDVLVVFDAREAEASLRQAEGSLQQAQARLRTVTGDRAPATARDFEEASLNYEAAREELERAEELFEAGVGTRAEVEQRRRELERARLGVERARLRVEETSRSGSAVAEAAAAVQQAQAARDLAALRLQEHRIRAPFGGVILRRRVERGQVVQPGVVVMELTGDEIPEIRIEPDEREVGNLRPGLVAMVVADAFPGAPIRARLDRVDPAVDRERATVTAYLRLEEEPPVGFRAEMTVSVDIELRREENGMVLPVRAVRARASDAPFVLVVEGDQAVRREVRLGLSSDEYLEILEGLKPGAEVILSEEMEEGDRVRR